MAAACRVGDETRLLRIGSIKSKGANSFSGEAPASEYPPDRGFRLIGQGEIGRGAGGHQEISSTRRGSVVDWSSIAQSLSASARYTPWEWLMKVTPCPRQPLKELVMMILVLRCYQIAVVEPALVLVGVVLVAL